MPDSSKVFRPSSSFSIKPSSLRIDACDGECDRVGMRHEPLSPTAFEHDSVFGLQLPEQFQGRRVVAGGLQLVLEFLFGGAA